MKDLRLMMGSVVSGLIIALLVSWVLVSYRPDSSIMPVMLMGTSLFALFSMLLWGVLVNKAQGGPEKAWIVVRLSLLFVGVFIWFVLPHAIYPSGIYEGTNAISISGGGAAMATIAFFLFLPW